MNEEGTERELLNKEDQDTQQLHLPLPLNEVLLLVCIFSDQYLYRYC